MAATGYSPSLVGKYGVKSIYQSIKRAESHIFMGDFVKNVCDEFYQGYVVARVIYIVYCVICSDGTFRTNYIIGL